MLEVGVFNNGANGLPIRVADGVTLCDASLTDVHRANQETAINQVRQGILSDQLGFDYFFLTEHHFIAEGVEFSPNPLLIQMAVASRTKKIRLGQMANIITWHHPVRLAEQAGILDVVSGGRLEFGIGRGYQARENETLGRPYGSTIQDQERNRVSFEEAYDIILKAWTEPSMSHHGEFFSIPPSYTKWNHRQTEAFFGSEKVTERSVDDVLSLGPPDMYSSPIPIAAAGTTLREISVFPQPIQKPYPQMWMPLTSERSIRWAAQKGVNGYVVGETADRLKQKIDVYLGEAEKNSWPDRLGRGAFSWGWDSEKKRGLAGIILLPGKDSSSELERFKRALELQWDYYIAFGFGAALAEPGEPVDFNRRITGDMLLEKGLAVFGTPDEVGEKILGLKSQVGYDDFLFNAWFEKAGFEEKEVEEQMAAFAEEVLPGLRQACGGGREFPESGVDLDVGFGG
jgi:alkanesulfonate monooxygenase SsuD/methylene tetrahydromethanopterin reductase-like flavin-dependent oxidoreductase (luciferase family)